MSGATAALLLVLLCELTSDRLYFEALTPEGRQVDSGRLERRAGPPATQGRP